MLLRIEPTAGDAHCIQMVGVVSKETIVCVMPPLDTHHDISIYPSVVKGRRVGGSRWIKQKARAKEKETTPRPYERINIDLTQTKFRKLSLSFAICDLSQFPPIKPLHLLWSVFGRSNGHRGTNYSITIPLSKEGFHCRGEAKYVSRGYEGKLSTARYIFKKKKTTKNNLLNKVTLFEEKVSILGTLSAYFNDLIFFFVNK